MKKEKKRDAIKIDCKSEVSPLKFEASRISHATIGLVFALEFHTEDTDDIWDTVNRLKGRSW